MPFTIHFRGVSVFASKADRIMEVLFPNAETRLPPEGTIEKLYDSDGTVIAELMRHVDRSPARKHYAGAVIVRKQGETNYRKLLGCEVSVATGNGGAQAQGNLLKDPPPLVDVITDPSYKLRLLDVGQRVNPDYVTTRFILDGGKAFAEHHAMADWELDGGKRGKKIGPKRFAAGVKWEIAVPGPKPKLELHVKSLDGNDSFESIVLTDERDTVYFYNFDSALPTVKQLTDPEVVDKDYAVDHDFKWVYKLLAHKKPTWKDWLDNGSGGLDKFPAPRRLDKAAGTEETKGTEGTKRTVEPLIPVSTCFQTIWPDE